MKKSSLCLLYAVLLFPATFFAQSESGNGRSFAVDVEETNHEDYLSRELEEMIVWRLEESAQINRNNDDLLLERRELDIMKETAVQKLVRLEEENERMVTNNLALAEENNRLVDAREILIERINDLVREEEENVAVDEEEWDIMEEENRQRLETLQILEQQLAAYDRELDRNEEIIRIQDSLIDDNEEAIFASEEEADICQWLSESDLNLLKN